MEPIVNILAVRFERICATVASLIVIAIANGVDARADESAELLAAVRDYEVMSIDVPQTKPEQLAVPLDIDGANYTIALQRTSVWAPGATIKVYRGAELIEERMPPTPNTYRGTVDGIAGSVVTAAIKHDGLHATIRIPGQPTKSLAPVDNLGTHMLYKASDFAELPMACDEPAGDNLDLPATPHDDGPATNGVGTASHVAELALDCDVEYFQRNGSSVNNTLDEMALVINNVNEAYERDTNITHILTTAIVRTAEPDPYTSTNGATINQEQATSWTTNQTDVAYDLVLLFTDKDTCSPGSGCGLAGRANVIGDVCNRNTAFCFTEARSNNTTQAQIAAHELGHLWNGRHCNSDPASNCIGVGQCLLMCSTINACDNSGDVEFGNCNANRVIAHRNSRDCLDSGSNGTQWVEWRSCGIFCNENGDFDTAHNTVVEAVVDVPAGGTIVIKAGSSSDADGDETFPLTISKNVTLRTFNGVARIGE